MRSLFHPSVFFLFLFDIHRDDAFGRADASAAHHVVSLRQIKVQCFSFADLDAGDNISNKHICRRIGIRIEYRGFGKVDLQLSAFQFGFQNDLTVLSDFKVRGFAIVSISPVHLNLGAATETGEGIFKAFTAA